jgi:L-seryl-tRNA(Ser) seleniumtransferase
LRLLTRPVAAIREQAMKLLQPMRAALGARYQVEITTVQSQPGSGSLPSESLESCAIRIRCPDEHAGTGAAALARAFRALPIPVIGRLHDGGLYLDLRCMDGEDEFAAQLPALRLEPPS